MALREGFEMKPNGGYRKNGSRQFLLPHFHPGTGGRQTKDSERSRIARDLHDLLGHSLTTITVKAGLACRLGQTDPGRATREITEVEDLSRRALAEVRATVSSYRDVTLAGELAQGRELLRPSGVAADFPTATDGVDAAHQELFGWAVREGLTNVARHARVICWSVMTTTVNR